MTQHEARQWGRSALGEWLFQGQISSRSVSRRCRGDLTAVFRLARLLSAAPQAGPAGRLLLDQLWLLQREGEQAAQALHGLGNLPAVPFQGRCARVALVGERLAESKLDAWEDTFAALDGLQEVSPLSEAELRALMPCLVLGVVHRIRTVTEHWQESEETAAALKECFQRLRLYTAQDRSASLESLSVIHRCMRGDKVYLQMEAESRAHYRRTLARKALGSGKDEGTFARELLQRAREEGIHLGFLLYPHREGGGSWYPAAVVSLSVLLSAVLALAVRRWWAILLTLLPLSELVKQTLDFLTLHLVRPRPVFRLELKEGVPPEGKTLCVIAALLTDEKEVKNLCQRLEDCYLTNRSAAEQVNFGLLSDPPDSPAAPGAEEQKLLKLAEEGIQQLNRRWGERFFLFTRQPRYVKSDDVYRGWERKRGALMELMSLLRGAPSGVEVYSGDAEKLKDTAFLLTLDSDSRLSPDGVVTLVGTMLHPLNRAVVDEKRRIVVRGHGLLQPRMVTQLQSANASPFAALFCGAAGNDPYTCAAGELYHDLFDRCSYCGKGLLDIDAALRCLSLRFPENRILSHDLLEGAYLRCGACPHAEAADGFPSTPQSYFRRQHRWVRGDWQAFRWCLSTVPLSTLVRERNPLTPIDRGKLFDNLRRSLLPPFQLLSLTVWGLGLAPFPVALAAVLSLGLPLLLSGAELSLRRFQGCAQRTFERRYDGFTGSLERLGAKFLLLPVESWCNASAALTALWRLRVSHRGLLEWTVSAQAQGSKWFWVPSVAWGASLLVLAPSLTGKILGLLWLCAALVLEPLSRQREAVKPLSRRERSFLGHQGALIWTYFDTWLTPEDHYLPPDNVQERPSLGPARRTSPTNIGFALLSCLAAVDLNLGERERPLSLIAHQLDSLEKLEKWQGHLYNWYDTATAQPLYPRYVSTVDSGNLCAALLTLEQGLSELGEPSLARRAGALAAGMGFRPLYDPERELFYIGWDAESNSFTDSRYDLLASEARLTSYLAVARGEIPRRHWQRLGRSMCQEGHRFGLVSWSGTLFEYFMPHLLLSLRRGSTLWETLCFCVWVQRRWGAKLGLPWGVSESAFFQLDQNQSYQYKAHGVPPLGLCPALERERVAAPYASFLALSADPHAAIENLRSLSALGAEGRHGLYEAVDFTPSRTGGQGVIIRSWMVHHLGMSLVAIDNALCKDVMQRRFMAHPQMRAHQCLLEERFPLGLRPPKRLRLTTERSKMNRQPSYQRQGQGFDPCQSACHLLSAAELTLPAWADGSGSLRQGGLLLCKAPILTLTREGMVYPLLPAGGGGAELVWNYRGREQTLTLTTQEIQLTLSRRLEESGLVSTLTARGIGTLTLCLRPILAHEAAYRAHPAFNQLGLKAKTLPSGVSVQRRKGKGDSMPELVILWEGARRLAENTPSSLKLELPLSGGEARLRWAVCPGQEGEAYHAAQGLLMGAKEEGTDAFSAQAMRWALKGEEQRRLDALTALLLRPRPHQGQPLGQRSLWPYGISGDVPIWAVAGADASTAERCVRCWAALRGCGLVFDLVLLTQSSVLDAMKAFCEGHNLGRRLGGKGGIHLVEAAQEARAAILPMAEVVGLAEEGGEAFSAPLQRPHPIPQGTTPPKWHWEECSFVLETGGGLLPRRWSHILTNGRFGWSADDAGTGHFWSGNAHENKLTPWYNDPTASAGPEGLFLVEGDRKTSLFAAADGIPCRITYGPGWARWEKEWEGRRVKLTAFVPVQGEERIFLVEGEGFASDAALEWNLELQMAQRRRDAQYVTLEAKESRILARNTAGGDFSSQILTLCASVPLTLVTGNRPGLLRAECPLTPALVLSCATMLSPTVDLSAARSALAQTEEYWKSLAGSLRFQTPDQALNHYLSFWGRYQTIACRLMARTALYQCGGAYGFRDQLQDALCLLPHAPDLAREQILRSCAHQYREGDVQHWWHPLPLEDRGVRTRISDDLLWLPWAVCRWVKVTGERTLLEEAVPYLNSEPLQKGEKDRYESAVPSEDSGTVLEHCLRSAERVLARGCGEHGLLLMLGGDWNDGMDRLGAQGKGESVWLTWFAALVLRELAPLCEPERRERYETLSRSLAQRADEAWDGRWYRRAYSDTGEVIGSRESPWCRMDSIAQSFAVFAPSPNSERARQGVEEAIRQLYNPQTGTVALLTPPFPPQAGAGYLCLYPEGVRENGAQYTHAAVWLALAALRLGKTEEGWTLLGTLLPEHHDNSVYQGEPYVLPGDVSTAPGQEGQAGWSWYTGAASWFCRTAEEELLGLKVQGGRLYVEPRLPAQWPGYEVYWQLDKASLHLTVSRGTAPGWKLNGKKIQPGLELSTLSGNVDLEVEL